MGTRLLITILAVLLGAAMPGSAPGADRTTLESAVRGAIRNYLAEHAGVPVAEAFVGDLRLAESRAIPPGAEIVRVGADGAVRSGRAVPFSVYLKGPTGDVREVRAAADVSLLVPVVVSARNVPAGAVIGPEDVSVRTREYTASAEGYCNRAADVVGRKARWQLTSGVPVRKDYLEDPEALRRGDPVLVVAESGFVRITGKAVALQGGRVGETVMVRNLATGRETAGRLHPGRVVRVD